MLQGGLFFELLSLIHWPKCRRPTSVSSFVLCPLTQVIRAAWSSWHAESPISVPSSSDHHSRHHQRQPPHNVAHVSSTPPHVGVSNYRPFPDAAASYSANIPWKTTFRNEAHEARDLSDEVATTGGNLLAGGSFIASYKDPTTASQSWNERENWFLDNAQSSPPFSHFPAHSLLPSLITRQVRAMRSLNLGLLGDKLSPHQSLLCLNTVTNQLISTAGHRFSTDSHHGSDTRGLQSSKTGRKDDDNRAVTKEPSSEPMVARDSSGAGRQEKQDGREQSWIDRLLPPPARPFAYLARLDKPTGTWLLAWPCFW